MSTHAIISVLSAPPARPGGFWAACRPGSVIAFPLTRVRVIRRYYILFLYFHVITGGGELPEDTVSISVIAIPAESIVKINGVEQVSAYAGKGGL